MTAPICVKPEPHPPHYVYDDSLPGARPCPGRKLNLSATPDELLREALRWYHHDPETHARAVTVLQVLELAHGMREDDVARDHVRHAVMLSLYLHDVPVSIPDPALPTRFYRTCVLCEIQGLHKLFSQDDPELMTHRGCKHTLVEVEEKPIP